MPIDHCEQLRRLLTHRREKLARTERELAQYPPGYSSPPGGVTPYDWLVERKRLMLQRIPVTERRLQRCSVRMQGLGSFGQVVQDCEAIKVQMQRQLKLAKTRSQAVHRKRAAAQAAKLKIAYDACVAGTLPPGAVIPGMPGTGAPAPGSPYFEPLPDTVVTPDGVFQFEPEEASMLPQFNLKTLAIVAAVGIGAYFLFSKKPGAAAQK